MQRDRVLPADKGFAGFIRDRLVRVAAVETFRVERFDAVDEELDVLVVVVADEELGDFGVRFARRARGGSAEAGLWKRQINS